MVVEHPYGRSSTPLEMGARAEPQEDWSFCLTMPSRTASHSTFFSNGWIFSCPVAAVGSNEGPGWKQSHSDRESSFLLLYHRSKESSFSEASVTLGFIFMWNNKCFNTIWLAFLWLSGKHLDNTCYFLWIFTSHRLQHFNKRCVCTCFPFFTFKLYSED